MEVYNVTTWKSSQFFKIQMCTNDSAIPLLRIYPKEVKLCAHKKIYTQMLIITVLSVAAKNYNLLKYPLADKLINKEWYIHTVEYCLTMKTKELLIHAAMWVNLNIIMPSEIDKTEYLPYDSIYMKL